MCFVYLSHPNNNDWRLLLDLRKNRIIRIKMISLQQISAWFRNINLFNDDFPDTRIPAALINDENNLLEESVEAKIKEIESIQLNIDEHNDRIQMLEDHHKIVQDEIRIIQVFIVNYILCNMICFIYRDY
jgi:hypothetical protein